MSEREEIREIKNVTSQAVGYEFTVEVETETAAPAEGTRASNKKRIKDGLSGHASTFEELLQFRAKARKELGLE